MFFSNLHVVNKHMKASREIGTGYGPTRTADVIDLVTRQEQRERNLFQAAAAATQKQNALRIKAVCLAESRRKFRPADIDRPVLRAEPHKVGMSGNINVVVLVGGGTEALFELFHRLQLTHAVIHPKHAGDALELIDLRRADIVTCFDDQQSLCHKHLTTK